LTACSEAGWEGYGPRNQGTIGYSDRQISENTFYVDYVEFGYAHNAREKAERRATELCVENGFARAEYNPKIQNQSDLFYDDLVIAFGNAKCLGAGEKLTQLTEKQRIERRIAEIDVDIASHNAGIGSSGEGQDLLTDPTLRGLDAFSSALLSRSHQNDIAKLQQERAQLVRRLQSL